MRENGNKWKLRYKERYLNGCGVLAVYSNGYDLLLHTVCQPLSIDMKKTIKMGLIELPQLIPVSK